jgi:hypothetical protein
MTPCKENISKNAYSHIWDYTFNHTAKCHLSSQKEGEEQEKLDILWVEHEEWSSHNQEQEDMWNK